MAKKKPWTRWNPLPINTPHQAAAVKAEVAYFNLDYERALALDLTILPWLEEWYYSNVSDEHMIAMTVAAIQLHREQGAD